MPLHKSLEIWTAQTLCNVGILFSILSFLLHIGRPYFEKHMRRFTLRVASDLWWVLYVVLRDGSLLVAVLIGFLHLNMDLMADIKIGLPFVPLATVAMAAALLAKVLGSRSDSNAAFRRSLALVSAGALLNTIGFAVVMEAPGDEYAAATSLFWQAMVNLRSNKNPELSEITFFVCFGLLLAIVLIATFRIFLLYGSSTEQSANDTRSQG